MTAVARTEVLMAGRWFVQHDRNASAWCVCTVNKPPEDHDWAKGERILGWFISRAVAEHAAQLHNGALQVGRHSR